MAEAIFDSLDGVLTRWTMGSPAASAAPPVWRDEAGASELRLLALTAQFLGTAVVAAPPGELRRLVDLPTLPLPTVPEPLRPLTRRLLQSMKNSRLDGRLPTFLADRGWTLHPADWMPSATDERTPEVYAPWSDWVQSAASGAPERKRAGEPLTLDNWEDFWPAQRIAALSELRRHHPDSARALLEAKLPGESAEVRFRLLGIIATGLNEADADFLAAFAENDRAPKVRGLATSLLSRLGRSRAQDEETAELAGFFQVQTKGLFKRTRIVAPVPLKTQAQINRRSTLFDSVDLAAFAGALGVEPGHLLEAWTFGGDPAANQGFVSMVVRTGSDEAVAALADALVGCDAFTPFALTELLPRLDPTRRATIVGRILDRGDGDFEGAEEVALGRGRVDDPMRTRAGGRLLAMLRPQEQGSMARPAETELFALGLLASRRGAESALAMLTREGLLAGDPRLDMIRLNAALEDKRREG